MDSRSAGLNGMVGRHTRRLYNGRAHGGGLRRTVRLYREKAVMDLVQGLGLQQGSPVLEIGCGRESLALALARSNYRITSVDRLMIYLELLHKRAEEAGLTGNITTMAGDAYSLGGEDGSFDLVLALGVIPWLGSPEKAVKEILRVVRPGGTVIFTVYNRWRLDHLLDPRLNPVLSPVWEAFRGIFERMRRRSPLMKRSFPRVYSAREFDRLLASAGFERSLGMSIAFGPFSLFGKRVVPDPIGCILQRILQKLAEWDIPGIRYAGNHYLVLARRPGTPVGRDARRVMPEHHDVGTGA